MHKEEEMCLFVPWRQGCPSGFRILTHLCLFAKQFAEVSVQFRAPSLAAANSMIEEHQAMVDMFSQPGGCSGRRALLHDTDGSSSACEAELAAARSHAKAAEARARDAEAASVRLASDAQELATQLLTATAAIKAAEARAAAAEARAATAEAEARAAVADANDVATPETMVTVVDATAAASTLPAHHRYQSNRRREQEDTGNARTPALETTTDSASGQTVACAVAPCEMQNVCLNGGACETVAGSGSVSAFRCTCVGDYYGVRCATVRECASAPCQNGGACADSTTDASIDTGAYYCSCGAGSGWEGGERSDNKHPALFLSVLVIACKLCLRNLTYPPLLCSQLRGQHRRVRLAPMPAWRRVHRRGEWLQLRVHGARSR
eukprot:SAG22_NODE_3364_length_1757_cov_2.051870_1_plen_379_part_00